MPDDRDKDAPSLEPPSLFGRKKKKPAPTPAETVADETVREPVQEPVLERAPDPAPVVDESPTTILDEPAAPVEPSATPPVDPPVTSSLTPPPAPAPKEPRAPWATGRVAAVLAGLLVGALIVGATAGGLRLCTEVKGTSSCGGPGLFMLIAILVVAILVGAALLRAAHVPEAGSTSFLAVGLLSVVALLFLIDQLFAWWMIIVIPIVSVATFLLSHWVTTTYADPAADASDPDQVPEPHDVR